MVYLSQASAGLAPAEQLAERCLALKQLVVGRSAQQDDAVDRLPRRHAGDDATAADAVEAGIWAFARTLANEIHSLDIRLVDLMPGLSADVAARRLRDVVLSGTAETEIILDASGTRVVRFEKLALDDGGIDRSRDHGAAPVEGRELEPRPAALGCPRRRRAPEADEVEIAVEAAGLNFRDVMWGLSILPEEILEDGYAGATLGLECAGTRRAGRPGRHAASRSATRCWPSPRRRWPPMRPSPPGVVAPIPDGMSTAAAATVPVAFLTAYYALIRCARLDGGRVGADPRRRRRRRPCGARRSRAGVAPASSRPPDRPSGATC